MKIKIRDTPKMTKLIRCTKISLNIKNNHPLSNNLKQTHKQITKAIKSTAEGKTVKEAQIDMGKNHIYLGHILSQTNRILSNNITFDLNISFGA